MFIGNATSKSLPSSRTPVTTEVIAAWLRAGGLLFEKLQAKL